MGFKDPNHEERLRAAQAAKKAALEKFRAKPGPDDPVFIAREKERLAVLAAREERKAAREALAAEKAAQEERARELAKIALQEELDWEVYGLYGLTEDEVRMVEGNPKNTK